MKPILISLLALFLFLPLLHAEYTATQQAQIAALKKTYPLDACPVSGEKLGGGMGPAFDYLYTAKDAHGKETTRLVRFCCPGCVSQFTANPQPFLQKIDQAAAAKKKAAASGGPSAMALGSRSPCCTSAGGCCVTTNGCCESAH